MCVLRVDQRDASSRQQGPSVISASAGSSKLICCRQSHRLFSGVEICANLRYGLVRRQVENCTKMSSERFHTTVPVKVAEEIRRLAEEVGIRESQMVARLLEEAIAARKRRSA